MYTILIILATVWTLYWCVMQLVLWGRGTAESNVKVICSTCGAASMQAGAVSSTQSASHSPASNSIQTEATSNKAKPTPLFQVPDEKDDLKVIKGIGDVMERTLNDLGITTFKQLAGFKEAEIKMVADVLSESNAGFGDRIERDEWVEQARQMVT